MLCTLCTGRKRSFGETKRNYDSLTDAQKRDFSYRTPDLKGYFFPTYLQTYAGNKRSVDELKRSYNSLTNEQKRSFWGVVRNGADAIGFGMDAALPYVEKAIDIVTPIVETVIG